jgi:hypothetical protein
VGTPPPCPVLLLVSALCGTLWLVTVVSWRPVVVVLVVLLFAPVLSSALVDGSLLFGWSAEW